MSLKSFSNRCFFRLRYWCGLGSKIPFVLTNMDARESDDATAISCSRTRTETLSFDISEALQEAREIMTDGRPRERHLENLLEESTTVQVRFSRSDITFRRALLHVSSISGSFCQQLACFLGIGQLANAFCLLIC